MIGAVSEVMNMFHSRSRPLSYFSKPLAQARLQTLSNVTKHHNYDAVQRTLELEYYSDRQGREASQTPYIARNYKEQPIYAALALWTGCATLVIWLPARMTGLPWSSLTRSTSLFSRWARFQISTSHPPRMTPTRIVLSRLWAPLEWK
jgi:hypothetical protein